MSKYQTFGHAKTRIRYHLIFSTKYRTRCLEDISDAVKDVFTTVEASSDFRLHAIGVDADHVHLVVSFRPNWSVAQIVRRLKQGSTHLLWETQEPHLRKFYWGAKKRLWTNGYFVETVGSVSEDKILDYVRDQGRRQPPLLSYAKLKTSHLSRNGA